MCRDVFFIPDTQTVRRDVLWCSDNELFVFVCARVSTQ